MPAPSPILGPDADPAAIRRVLADLRVIAVVGCSDDPARDSHRVASYLQRAGYRIIPVNPNLGHVLHERAWPRLEDVPEPVDCVDVFRRSEAVPPVAASALAIGARVLWLQDGVIHPAAAAAAAAGGCTVVMDRCLMRDHASLLGARR